MAHQEVSDTFHNASVQSFSGLSDKAKLVFAWVNYAVVCQAIVVFGVVSNIINVVCFVKQGFKEPINISLTGLAFSDLGSLITLLLMDIFYTPAVSAVPDLNFDVIEVAYVTCGLTHVTFTRVTSWITALITLERCVCVTAPLQVSTMITPRQVSVIIVCMYIIHFATSAPAYMVNTMGMKYVPTRNKTIFGILYNSDRDTVERVSFIINNFLLPFVAFVVIIVCTVILVISLRNRNKWWKSAVAVGECGIHKRKQKVAKMVVMISTIFILCYSPCAIILLTVACEQSLAVGGQYVDIGIIIVGFIIILESINSSANIFIYYFMSSKYRDTLRSLCGVNTQVKEA